jgi:hypothetical protein
MEDHNNRRSLKGTADHCLEEEASSLSVSQWGTPLLSISGIQPQAECGVKSEATPPVQLCTRCAEIDFEKALHTSALNRHGDLAIVLGTFTEIKKKHHCRVCRFAIWSLENSEDQGFEDERIYLKAYSMNHLYANIFNRTGPNFKDSVVLGVVREWYVRSVGRSNECPAYLGTVAETIEDIDFGVRAIQRDKVDIGLARFWMDFCHTHHDEICSHTDRNNASNFKVIDCDRRIIVKAPSVCHYVALSYVWGPPIPGSINVFIEGTTLQQLPSVVEDSIKVAQQLGFRYLWVDRYCIDQSNAEEKHDQLRNMGLIYINAEAQLLRPVVRTQATAYPELG